VQSGNVDLTFMQYTCISTNAPLTTESSAILLQLLWRKCHYNSNGDYVGCIIFITSGAEENDTVLPEHSVLAV
jgi:hypothetical protein